MGQIETTGTYSRCSSLPNSTRIPESDLQSEIGRLVNGSMAVNTKETYRTGISSFETFRKEYNFNNIWPSPLSHVTHVIAYLSLKNRAYKTANCYISVVNYHCKSIHHTGFAQNVLVKKKC